MAVRGLEQTTTLLDQVKRLSGLVIVAVLVAAIVIGTLILTGLFRFVSAPQVTVVGITLPPEWTAFIGAFTLALVVILGYVYYFKLIRSAINRVKKFWLNLPEWAQAIVMGIQAALITALSFYLTDTYLYEFETTIIAGVSLGVGVVVTYLTIQVRDRGWTLRDWARTLYVGALIAGVVAKLAGFTFDGVIPGYAPPAIFLAGWSICLYLLFRRRHTIEDSAITRLLTRTGYAQMRQVETVSVAVATGFVLAVVVAALVGIAGTTPGSFFQRTALSVAVVWPMVTIATSVGWPTRERLELVIKDINVRSSTEHREVTLRNIGNQPINLRDAKMTDANNALYHLNISASLGAGETAKFEIPSTFELATHDRYTVFSLPFELVLTREATEPKVITRDGRKFVLVWADQVAEYRDGATA